MGQLYSIKELQDYIENLKHKVQNFNGTFNSKSYNKLQKEIIQANTAVLKLKKSRKTKTRNQCEKMWLDLNECTRVLQEKVGRNSLPSKQKEEIVSAPRRIRREADDVINYLEEETKNIEEDIEKMIKTNDYKKQIFIEAKLKIFFTDVAITKTENGSLLDKRKNQILQRLLACYKQVKNDYDSDFYSEFGSEFGGSSKYTDSTRTSMRSNIYEEISYNEEVPKTSQGYKKEVIHVKKEAKINIQFSCNKEDFDDLLNIDEYDYEDVTYYGNSKKKVSLNLDEFLEDNSYYGNEEMDDFLKEVLEKNTYTKKYYEDVKKQSEKINFLNDELTKIKNRMVNFSGIYQDEEYFEIEDDLQNCLDNMEQIDDLGDSSIINGKEEHINYIQTLWKYFEDKTRPSEEFLEDNGIEEDEEEETNFEQQGEENIDHSDSDTQIDDFLRKKINPPILLKQRINSESDEETNLSLEPKRKINPPILKLSTNEETQQIKKINPPILKLPKGRSSEENKLDEEEKSKKDLFWLSDSEEQTEIDLYREDNNEEPISDALNIELLKRVSSIVKEPQSSGYRNVEYQDEHEEEEEQEHEELVIVTGSSRLMGTNKEEEIGRNNKSKRSERGRSKRTKHRSALVDYTEQIEEVLEDIEELKTLNENFKETRNYKIYSDMQEKLMKVIRIMFDMDRGKFDNKSLILYEIVSQDIQTFVNEL